MAEEKDNMVKNIENVTSLKDKLRTVTNEIDSIKNSFSKGAEDLTRIQSMLDVEHLEDLSGVIDKFENQVAQAEKKRQEAAEGAKKYSEELEKEKERLIKLWDAYKNQEEELSATEKKITEYEEKIRTAEAEKKQLEEDLTARINTLNQKIQENENKAQKFDEYKTRVEEFDEAHNRMEEEIHNLKNDMTKKDETITTLQKQLDELKNYEKYSEYKDKYESLNAEYEKEKERLTKLYQLYEETDTECKKLKEENNNWQKWFDSNKQIFDKLFSTGPPITTKETTTQPKTENPAEKPNEKKPKKKKKLRFKK